jgi:MoaA/NifB/PqqE/SkfB family radical SAM enzyme
MTTKLTLKKIIKAFVPYGIVCLYNRHLEKRERRWKLKGRKLLRFETHLADHCNLNCKGCDHFSPLANKKLHDLDIFEKDCRRISELTKGRIEMLGLLGGEPLLHPDINKFMDVARKYFKSCKILITTNGTLLLKQDEIFWRNCRKNKVSITVSGYPVQLDVSAIKQKASEYNVKMYTPGIAKTMYKFPFDIEGKQNAEESFKKCFHSNTCIFLEDGKLYTCPMIPTIKHFNQYFNKKLEVSEKDYIDIYKAQNIKEILDFLCHPVPFCRYCRVNDVQNGLAWGVSKKEISEWT